MARGVLLVSNYFKLFEIFFAERLEDLLLFMLLILVKIGAYIYAEIVESIRKSLGKSIANQ